MTNYNGLAIDGTNDSQITVLDMNSAMATPLAYLDNGCTNYSLGQFGNGPTVGLYASNSTSTFFLYLTEWDLGGNACIATGENSAYTMTIALSPAVSCTDASAGLATTSTNCVDYNSTFIASSSDAIVPVSAPAAGFTWIISTEPLSNLENPFFDPAFVNFTTFEEEPYDIEVTNNQGDLPAGYNYYFTAVVLGNAYYDPTTGSIANIDTECIFLSNTLMIEFMVDGDFCSGGGIDCSTAVAGTISADNLCLEYGDDLTLETTGALIPGTEQDAGFKWLFFTEPITNFDDPWSDPALTYESAFGNIPYDFTITNNGSSGFLYVYSVVIGNADYGGDNGDDLFYNIDSNCLFYSDPLVIEVVEEGAQCIAVNVQEFEEISSYQVYPNPASTNINIKVSLNSRSDVELEIMDVTGKKVLFDNQSDVMAAEFNMDLRGLVKGVYFAQISTNNQMISKKIIKSN